MRTPQTETADTMRRAYAHGQRNQIKASYIARFAHYLEVESSTIKKLWRLIERSKATTRAGADGGAVCTSG